MNPESDTLFGSHIPVPEMVTDWVGTSIAILYILIGIWVVLKVFGYFQRRAYNLTPMETVSSKGLKPDFTNVDHEARRAQIDAGAGFGASPATLGRALTATRITIIFMAIASFLAAVVFASVRLDELEAMWLKYSLWERFSAIVADHPVGLAIAVLLIIGATGRFVLMQFRRDKS